MSLNARTATAKDFDEAAQSKANFAWGFGVLTSIIFYFFSWWALVTGAITLLTIIQSVSATKQASNLRNGTYKIPNPNNGIDDSE
tara:strand:- start:1341 stop:1595 length:255 start_codon:yes stop_codon:yes gene_type:complete